MAASKFATMLQRNTNRMGVVLVYTLLEWILIGLLLLNAMSSYLIARFAAFFGLKPPCFLCSRLDRALDPDGGHGSYERLLCGEHAAGISRLGFCLNHRRLAEASEMCEECCASCRPEGGERTRAVLAWTKRSEKDEKDLKCSCCGVSLESGFCSTHLLLGTCCELSGDPTKKELLLESYDELPAREEVEEAQVVSSKNGKQEEEDNLVEQEERRLRVEQEEGEAETGTLFAEQEQEQELEEEEDTARLLSCHTSLIVEDRSLEILTLTLENEPIEDRLVPVELIDSETLKVSQMSQMKCSDGKLGICEEEVADLNVGSGSASEEEIALGTSMEVKDEVGSATIEVVEIIEEYAVAPLLGDYKGDGSFAHECVVPGANVTTPHDGEEVTVESLAKTKDSGELQDIEVESHPVAEDLGEPQGLEEDTKTVDAEASCELSIGSEIPDQEQIDHAQVHKPIPFAATVEDQCSERYSEQVNEEPAAETEQVETTTRAVDRLPVYTELNEVEEERAPETPTYIEGIHALHKRSLFERRESGNESIDGSVASEIEGAETLTTDHLKAALKAEHKALGALYAELEEERSASAIAANQTMAMITRLQEEKAAMQMEALQYQRMMEEQSEYDQEALQLLNELMMKREKEKQELEKELEVCRRKVLLYESQEKRKMTGSKALGRSGTSSSSSSGDSDDLSFDIDGGDEYVDVLQENNQNTPPDTVLSSETDPETTKHLITLDESLADFEEERLAILEQLKALEEKLFTLDDEDPSDTREFAEHFSEENSHGMNGLHDSLGDDVNGFMNGLSDDNDTKEKLHSESKSMGYRGKRLLPLFDAFSLGNDELCTNQEAVDTSPQSVSNLAMVQKKLAIAEEVDNVYERLQALEADREFLKHCISSLKKGDKGMDLLQEILQHLRDLRAVELRVRNADDAFASLST